MSLPREQRISLWRSWDHKEKAADELRLTADHMLKFGLVDGILPEPLGGAHWDYDAAAESLKKVVMPIIKELQAMDPGDRQSARIDKFSRMGFWQDVPQH